MLNFVFPDADGSEAALNADRELETRDAAAALLWPGAGRAGGPNADAGTDAEEAARLALAERWPAPDPEEEAILAAACSMARRRLGAPIAAAALAGSQAGVILPAGDRTRLVLPASDPILQLLREAAPTAALRNASDHPAFCESALCARGVGARAVLAAPVRLPGGAAFGALIAAGQCETTPTDRQREELRRIAERAAEEILSRYAARSDAATGAASPAGLIAALRRESRRAALHGRPACVAVIALHRAPGAPLRHDPGEVSAETRAAVIEDLRLADPSRLPDATLKATVDRAISGLRASDMVAVAPTPTDDLPVDAALDMPALARAEGPSCIALLMPETAADAGHACVRRMLARLAGTDLPDDPRRRIAASAGLATVTPDEAGARDAAIATLEGAYAALEIARRDQRMVGRVAA